MKHCVLEHKDKEIESIERPGEIARDGRVALRRCEHAEQLKHVTQVSAGCEPRRAPSLPYVWEWSVGISIPEVQLLTARRRRRTKPITTKERRSCPVPMPC